jgi:hypothetical protein
MPGDPKPVEMISHPIEQDCLYFSFGVEETMILFQPGAMFRATLESHPDWSTRARFLTRQGSAAAGGMLAILPRAAGSALLSASAGHPVERDLQEIIFAALTPGERPSLGPGGSP